MSALGEVCFDMHIESLKEERAKKHPKFTKEWILVIEETGYKKSFASKKQALKEFKIANEIYVPKLYERVK